MRLHEIMTTDVATIDPDADAGLARERMEAEGLTHLVVEEGERVLGLLSEDDLGRAKQVGAGEERTVREIMRPQTETATPETSLREAANLMRGRRIDFLPVLNDGQAVGIVAAADVIDAQGRLRGPGTEGAHAPQPDSAQRAPFAEQIPRAQKREMGRTEAAEVPAHIRAVGLQISAMDRDYLRRKLGRKLGKFALAIERVSVRLEDVNGPRGGVDKRCRIKVVLSGLPSVLAEAQHEALRPAMDGALNRAERAVHRALDAQRTAEVRPRREDPQAPPTA